MDEKSGTPKQQAVDATICSMDSNSEAQGSLPKPEGKIKAYVDFSNFNRNYEEYLKQAGQKSDKASANGSQKPDSRSSQASKDWVVLE